MTCGLMPFFASDGCVRVAAVRLHQLLHLRPCRPLGQSLVGVQAGRVNLQGQRHPTPALRGSVTKEIPEMMDVLRDRGARPLRVAGEVCRDVFGRRVMPRPRTRRDPSQERTHRSLVIHDRIGREAALVAQCPDQIVEGLRA
jgi:hypothetical protein